MEKQKRERSVNFTQEETNLLISLAEAKKHIIENKKSDATTWQEKEKAWKDIEKAFNSASDAVFRDHKHLKIKYEGIKRDTRKKSAMARAERYKTGGGTSTAPVLTPAEEKVKEIILLSVEGNDLVLPSTSTSSSITCVPAEDHSDRPATDQIMITDGESDNAESQWKEWNPTDLKHKKHSVLCKPKEKKPFDKLTEERLEIAKIQKKVIEEELANKYIQRKILEKELEHKDAMQDLEKEHLLLKIALLKKELE